jgi:hypothetical protein
MDIAIESDMDIDEKKALDRAHRTPCSYARIAAGREKTNVAGRARTGEANPAAYRIQPVMVKNNQSLRRETDISVC